MPFQLSICHASHWRFGGIVKSFDQGLDIYCIEVEIQGVLDLLGLRYAGS
jgi:hypothetical protein